MNLSSSLPDPLPDTVTVPITAAPPPRARLLRAWLIVAALVLALLLYAIWANRSDPIRGWFALTVLRHWGYELAFLAAVTCAGWRALALLLPAPPPLGERLCYAVALGALVFGLGMFGAGLAGLLHPAWFFVWPIALIAWGAPCFVRDLSRAQRRLRRFGARLYTPRTLPELGAAALLLLSLVAIHVLVVTPENIGWDARWYHLSIAEHYVAAGKIRAFGEGWYLGAYPQLATWLYTWAFLAPGGLFEHALLSAHVEWFLFLATLPAVSALTRRLLGGTRVPWAAAAVFVFPGIFLYDSSLIVGADHVLAFWAPVIGLALVRAGRSFDRRHGVLLGLMTAGAVLTKYQALYFVVPVLLLIAWRAARTRQPGPALAFGVAALGASAPHWLKNVLWYGNPTYPLLPRLFPSRPFHHGAEILLEQIYMTPLFALKGSFLHRVGATALTLLDFSFVPNDWMMFHGHRPVFGSLFTLLLPVLFFVKTGARLWALVLACHAAIAIWYVTSHQDRFLQALLPWFAACTAALLVATWQQLPRARVALAALVGFQLVWGGDLYFLRSHAMVGDSPLKPFVDRMAAGFEGKGGDRYKFGGRLAEIGRGLPRPAKVLVHDMNVKLGLGAETVMDEIGWQGLFDYSELETPATAFALWRRLGVTHVLWFPDRGDQGPRSLAREAVFARTVTLHRASEITSGEYRITDVRLGPGDAHAEAPDHARAEADAEAARPTRLVWLGCGGDPGPGIYTPVGLAEGHPLTPIAAEALASHPAQALGPANAAIIRPGCASQAAAMQVLTTAFERVIAAGGVSLWVRKPAAPAPERSP